MSTNLTRDLGAFEHLIWATDQWTPRHFAVVARIEGRPLSVERLPAALREAQRRHPALRVGIGVDGSGRPQFTHTDSPIQLRIVERANDTHWRTEAEAQLASSFRAEEGPLLRATLVRGEAASELMLAVYHSLGDGISAMYLVRDLLQCLEGHQLAELPPRDSLEALSGYEANVLPGQLQSPDQPTRLDRPGKPTVASFEIEPHEVESILSRCRKENATLQGALMAAALLSIDGRDRRCLAPVNVRRLCPPIDDDFGLYISAGVASLDPGSARNFWRIARTAREQVVRALEPQPLQARSAAMASLVAANPDPKSVYEAYRRGVMYQVVLSNLGRFSTPPGPGNLRVTAIYPLLNAELEAVVAVATVGGRTCVTLTSGGPAHGKWFGAFQDLFRSATLPNRDRGSAVLG